MAISFDAGLQGHCPLVMLRVTHRRNLRCQPGYVDAEQNRVTRSKTWCLHTLWKVRTFYILPSWKFRIILIKLFTQDLENVAPFLSAASSLSTYRSRMWGRLTCTLRRSPSHLLLPSHSLISSSLWLVLVERQKVGMRFLHRQVVKFAWPLCFIIIRQIPFLDIFVALSKEQLR